MEDLKKQIEELTKERDELLKNWKDTNQALALANSKIAAMQKIEDEIYSITHSRTWRFATIVKRIFRLDLLKRAAKKILRRPKNTY